jgi:hypothetical protein
MKKISTLLMLVLGTTFIASTQETVLWTGETSPEAITYYDMVGWTKTDPGITGKYVNFGTAEAIAYSSIVDNPEKAGINKTNKALILKSLMGKSWWPDFFVFTLAAPVSITADNRYLHIYHYRQNLNQGYSVNINKQQTWEDPDKGTKRFDGNLSTAGKWEDIVIDLLWFKENAEPLSDICILMDRNWGGGAEDPTDYYFDEVVLNNQPLARGVVLLEGTDLLNGQSQPQIDALTFDTQNGTNTYEFIANPFTTSTVNSNGKVLKFHKSADASWWQGMKVNFPGLHTVAYGTKQYLHVFVKADIDCKIQLQVIDNADGDRTEMFTYPKTEISGEWFDLVWDLSSYAAIKSVAVRFDVQTDELGGWINNTPAGDFYMDDITLDGNPDQRETTVIQSVKPSNAGNLKVYTSERTIYFSSNDAVNANVYDMLGRNVVSRTINNGSDLNALVVPNTGIYILKVGSKTGAVSTAKVFVK